MIGPQVSTLSDGKRLHFHHGPTDLIVEIFGSHREEAREQATERFQTVLTGLVAELPKLRCRYDRKTRFRDSTTRRMQAAVAPFSEVFITPMASVAGAVADEILGALTDGLSIRKAYVNNGGDIAFHLGDGQSLTVAAPTGSVVITHDSDARGLATSGWRGRSHSLGIADAVTVVARDAASADAAATLIANAVDVPDHPAVKRVPARELAPDSDLGEQLVTVDVGGLKRSEIEGALARGVALAERFLMHEKILGATLMLNGQTRAVTLS